MQDEDRIRQRAYEIWEQEGRPEGRHDQHWAQAQRELEGAARTSRPEFVANQESKDQAPRVDQHASPPPQMAMPGVPGGQFGNEATGNLSGGVGALLSQGSGAAGGNAGPLGGTGPSAEHHPGIGASLADSPPRVGPAPIAADDAGPGRADVGSPHGPTPGSRGTGRGKGTAGAGGGDALTEREAGLGVAGKTGAEAPGRITGRG
jgi:Protein of unknown function (DUF2934)